MFTDESDSAEEVFYLGVKFFHHGLSDDHRGGLLERSHDRQVIQNRREDELCKVAQEHLKAAEIQAPAMATGLSVEGYAEAETTEVGKLIQALEIAKTKEEAEAVITLNFSQRQASLSKAIRMKKPVQKQMCTQGTPVLASRPGDSE